MFAWMPIEVIMGQEKTWDEPQKVVQFDELDADVA